MLLVPSLLSVLASVGVSTQPAGEAAEPASRPAGSDTVVVRLLDPEGKPAGKVRVGPYADGNKVGDFGFVLRVRGEVNPAGIRAMDFCSIWATASTFRSSMRPVQTPPPKSPGGTTARLDCVTFLTAPKRQRLWIRFWPPSRSRPHSSSRANAGRRRSGRF